LFAAIPFVGEDLSLFIRGDYVVGDATLNRFFSFHVIAVPLVLIGLVVAHIFALHDVGSNNPDGVEIKGPKAVMDENGHPVDGIPFHPYYTVHDIFGISIFLTIFFAVVFFAPEMGGYFLEFNNFIPADPFTTPAHIAPVWYFTPFYSMLRATTDVMVNVLCVIAAVAVAWNWLKNKNATQKSKITLSVIALVAVVLLKTFDAKFWGVVVMGASVMILFFLPWLDKSPVRSIRYRPDWHKWIYIAFVIWFLILGYLGIKAPTPLFTLLAQVGTILYFAFFLLMPWWSQKGEFKTPPERINFTPH
jgi:ubiquinol-cytochrome c reductase cytochrome b subunit